MDFAPDIDFALYFLSEKKIFATQKHPANSRPSNRTALLAHEENSQSL